jgi:hypothetical protein
MGMFNDSVSPQRTQWMYPHTGAELLPFAEKMYLDFWNKEKVARDLMSEFMKDMNKSQNDPDIARAKRDIETFGTLKEQCSVFKMEFAKSPGTVYQLGLGDVTFFGLNESK